MLGRLVAEGLDVSLALAPILPGLTDSREDLEELLSAVAGAGVRSFFRQILFLRSPTKEKYLAWLSREFPSLEGPYRHAYSDRTRLGGAYPKRTLRVVDELASRYGLAQRSLPEKRRHLVQLGLFS